jgi:hypothetical protein
MVYGSWAERYSRTVGMPPRDIDVLVVGDDIDVMKLTVVADRVSDMIVLPVNTETSSLVARGRASSMAIRRKMVASDSTTIAIRFWGAGRRPIS